jgi:hypothetical protein
MADQLVHEVNQTPAGLGPGAQKPTRAGPGRIARNITGSIVSDADEPRSHNACSNDSDGVARRDHPRGVRHKVKSHGLMRVTHHPKPAAPKVLARSVRRCSSLSSHPGDGAGGNHGRMLAIRTVLSDRGAPRWTMAQASTPTTTLTVLSRPRKGRPHASRSCKR